MEPFKDRFKQILSRLYVFIRAAGAAVVLGCIEVFGSPRGRRYLAAASLVGCALLLVFRPPVQVVAPHRRRERRPRRANPDGAARP
jgi:hypothetical protein